MALHSSEWKPKYRPGFFGSRKKQKIENLNETFGQGNWTLGWVIDNPYATECLEFEEACKQVYEESYARYFEKHPEDVDFVCSFREVIDNAWSNVDSGLDYKIQEARGTHIQDIAIRNVLRRLGRHFAPFVRGDEQMLIVRGADTNGHRFNPGHIPLMEGIRIHSPSLAPAWAQQGSVEDFWQSNKYVFIREE